jgi:hypothetical protein
MARKSPPTFSKRSAALNEPIAPASSGWTRWRAMSVRRTACSTSSAEASGRAVSPNHPTRSGTLKATWKVLKGMNTVALTRSPSSPPRSLAISPTIRKWIPRTWRVRPIGSASSNSTRRTSSPTTATLRCSRRSRSLTKRPRTRRTGST